ncbi:MAG: hypothetical protein V4714_09835 [Bacteroidota bacterium]
MTTKAGALLRLLWFIPTLQGFQTLGEFTSSGNQKFGYEEQADGWLFYTLGADRINSTGSEMIAYVLNRSTTMPLQFLKADQHWTKFQEAIVKFVTDPNPNTVEG